MMPDPTAFSLFMTAALILAVTPGPGLFYVLTRSLKGGRQEGITSSMGTAVGGLFHVLAAACGLSAILMTSALAFTMVKLTGAAYLLYLGIKTLLSRDDADLEQTETGSARDSSAFYQGILTEVLNPKTALFFLAFIPQFVDPAQPLFWQFLILGSISVGLNTCADLLISVLAEPISQRFRQSPQLRKRQRIFSGCSLMGLGVYAAVAGHKQ